MSLISYGPGSETPAEALQNNGFWSDIDPANFRDTNRIDTSIPNARASHALAVAMADINRQLADWQADRQSEGSDTIENVTPPTWATADHYSLLYRQAVYASAHALLLERYRDYSATGAGDERGEAKDNTADDYRRDARWAVSEITGRLHTTVELI